MVRRAWLLLVACAACGHEFVGNGDGPFQSHDGGGAPGTGGAAGMGGSSTAQENCGNDRDDDGDGDVDCDDADCSDRCNADAFVDDDAPPGGDGSLSHPYDDIAKATVVCDGSAKTIFVFAGSYGPFTLPPSCRVIGEAVQDVVVDGMATRSVDVPDGGAPAAELRRLTLTGGDAGGEDGGCLRASAGTLTLGELRIASCTATRGGGISIEGASVESDDVKVSGCSATDGGGLRIGSGQLTATDWVFSENVASSEGGGLHVTGSAALVFENSTFEPNNVGWLGGGVYVEGGALSLVRSLVRLNEASDRGGGIYHQAGQLDLENVFVVDNSANTQSGGIHQEGGPTLFTHVTIAGNTSRSMHPGGICCAGGSGEHRNILIWGNPGGGSHGCPLSTSSIQEGPCCSNMSVDPLFIDAASGDYRLSPGSPVIGYGDPSTSSPVDYFGSSRDDMPDPGAHEAP